MNKKQDENTEIINTTGPEAVEARTEAAAEKGGHETFKKAFQASIPVFAGYLVLGTAFGVMLSSIGYGVWWALLMCLIIYGGSMQFAAVGLMASNASLLSAALLTVFINARHLFYGVSMLDKYRGTGKVKPYLIFALTDETYALVCTDPPAGVDRKRYDLYISLLDHSYWIMGSMFGAWAGSLLTISTDGIDFAMTALFVVIFTLQLLDTEDYAPAAIGLGSSLICLILFGAQNFLIPSMAAITILLLVLDVVRQKKEESR